jgi:hypothetical protein
VIGAAAGGIPFVGPRGWVKERGDMPGDQQDATFAAQMSKQLEQLQEVEATIVVPGWFAPSGNLWIQHLRAPVTINSPMLLPPAYNPFTLLIRGVKHLQSSAGGTTTELDLCIPTGLGESIFSGTDPNVADTVQGPFASQQDFRTLH